MAFTKACVEEARRPWRAERGEEASRRLRIFRPAWLEWLFIGHPAFPFVAGAVAIGALVEHSAGSGPTTFGLAFVLGALAWTLLEYLMHRFLFHLPARGEVGLVVTFLIHGHHHLRPRELDRLAATPFQSISIVLAFHGIARPLAPSLEAALASTVGFIAGYMAYEAVHYFAHHGRARSRLGRALQRHHLAHHARGDHRFGISSPLWDWVFRTTQSPPPTRRGRARKAS